MGVYSLKNSRKNNRRSSARTLRRRVGGDRESPNNTDCQICFEEFVAGETLKKCRGCRYKYHEHCIRTWCANRPNHPCSCPNCRGENTFSLRPPTPPARRPPSPPTRRRGRRGRSPSPPLIDVRDARRSRRRRTPSSPPNNNPYLRDFDGMM